MSKKCIHHQKWFIQDARIFDVSIVFVMSESKQVVYPWSKQGDKL